MRKNTMLVSAAITAFVLAMLAGVVSAYNGISSSKLLSQPSQNVQPIAMSIAVTPTQIGVVTAQDAATIASSYLKRTDLYSVELADTKSVQTDLNGVQAYKVTFSSGDIVYVGLDGQVLKATPPPAPVVIYANNGGGHHGGGGGGGNAAPPAHPTPPAAGGGGEHDGGGDHNGGGDD